MNVLTMEACYVFGRNTNIPVYAICRHVRRPPKKRDSPQYIVPTVTNAAKVMV